MKTKSLGWKKLNKNHYKDYQDFPLQIMRVVVLYNLCLVGGISLGSLITLFQ